MTLPKISQEPIIYIDATPTNNYPLRILKTYRENCNYCWVSNLNNPVINTMNKACEERAKLLDMAIKVLEDSGYFS